MVGRIRFQKAVLIANGLAIRWSAVLFALVVTGLFSVRASRGAAEEKEIARFRGEIAGFLATALRDRQADRRLSPSEQNLRNFDVRLSDVGQYIEVRFSARLAEGEDPKLGGGTSLGRDLAYVVRKTDGKLIDVHGFK